MDATRDVAVRMETIEMVAQALTAQRLASNTLGYALLAGLAVLTQG